MGAQVRHHLFFTRYVQKIEILVKVESEEREIHYIDYLCAGLSLNWLLLNEVGRQEGSKIAGY